jgi:glycosyltransferase A (GT-A) superfamily protein (DUF2064 family)
VSRVLVVAKSPVAGAVKTRLGADIGMDAAADLAAAALLDTLRACAAAYDVGRRHLALAGDLAAAVRGAAIERALTGWHVFPQHGEGFSERLVHAHATTAGRGTGPVVQIGMDTPQVTPDLLVGAVDALADQDAVLGPAGDGGWWVLALQDARRATPLGRVTMSTPATYADTHDALSDSGLRVATTSVLRDVDTVADADAVADEAPHSLFAEAWCDLRAR